MSLCRPTKASFTSLSHKQGEILVELYTKVGSLLAAPSMGALPRLLLSLVKVSLH